VTTAFLRWTEFPCVAGSGADKPSSAFYSLSGPPARSSSGIGSRRILGVVGLLSGVWGVLRLLAGLHAPPVMLPHDVLMLIVALVLWSNSRLQSGRAGPADLSAGYLTSR
jgi:hypothetical protein